MQRGYRGVVNRNNLPMLARMRVQEVKGPYIASMLEKMASKLERKMFDKADVCGWPCGQIRAPGFRLIWVAHLGAKSPGKYGLTR